MNKAEIIHQGISKGVYLNGEKLNGVLDFQIRKNSAHDSTELILILDTAELKEYFEVYRE